MSEDLKVVIGAGEYNKGEDWIHTQEEDLSLLKEEDWNKRFSHGSISAILSEHVWEHLSYEEGIRAAKICYKYLKPEGNIRCAVPDGFFPNEEYQNVVKIGGPAYWMKKVSFIIIVGTRRGALFIVQKDLIIGT